MYIVNLKEARSKLNIQEEMKQYGNIKSIKVRHEQVGETVNQINKGQIDMLRYIKTDMMNLETKYKTI